MKHKRKGIQKFRSLRSELKKFQKLSFQYYQQSIENKHSLECHKIHIGALREFILRCYQESHQIEITHSKQFLIYLTEILNIDIQIPHTGAVVILAPAQYVFWQRQKMSDDFRNNED